MDNMVKRIAIIPARGGSKRLPKKNIIDFKGKPMIAWTIEAALKSNLFNKVIVSTDSEEIKEIATHYGAGVPFFRLKTADDFSPVSLATIEALSQAEHYFGETYEHIIQLMANCPMRDEKNITEQYHKFNSNDSKISVLSGFSYGMFNPFWAHQIHEDGTCSKLLGSAYDNVRSQDLPKLLCPTGATWISKRDRLVDAQTYYSKGYQLFEIPWQRAIDIDDSHDFKMAEIVFDYEQQL